MPLASVPDKDDELLRALGEGEPHAVALLYQRHGSKMVAFARRYLVEQGSAEDVVAELLGRWLERPPRVHDAERLGAFLASSVYHAAVDWIRHDRAERGHPPRVNTSSVPGDSRLKRSIGEPREADSREMLQSRLAHALEQLSQTDRLLLEAHYAQALTAQECMDLLGISRDTFHQRLHRARTRLAQLLSANEAATLREGER